jgi:hypothetical protein
MQNLYFACTDCKIYVDAGYGWASWWLEEPRLVERGKPVLVDAVLSSADYWDPPKTDASNWLNRDVLPAVRCLLQKHRGHRIVFGTASDFLSFGDDGFLDWLQVGSPAQLLPRYFVERLGFVKWDEVCEFVRKQETEPWWWLLEWEGLHDKARRKFEELVKSRTGTPHRAGNHPCGA